MTPGAGPAPFQALCRTRVAAPPDVVFRAWSDPAMLSVWMAHRPSGEEGKARLVRVENVDIAPRVDAPMRIDMVTREADGTERTWVHEGRVVTADPPSPLAFTWISEGTHHLETTVALTFLPENGGTAVTLEHAGFNSQDTADGHAQGWEIFLELFNEAMTSAAAAGLKVTAGWLKKRLARKDTASVEGGAQDRTTTDREGDPAQGDEQGPASA